LPRLSSIHFFFFSPKENQQNKERNKERGTYTLRKTLEIKWRGFRNRRYLPEFGKLFGEKIFAAVIRGSQAVFEFFENTVGNCVQNLNHFALIFVL
jgi:hypothetical protein